MEFNAPDVAMGTVLSELLIAITADPDCFRTIMTSKGAPEKLVHGSLARLV